MLTHLSFCNSVCVCVMSPQAILRLALCAPELSLKAHPCSRTRDAGRALLLGEARTLWPPGSAPGDLACWVRPVQLGRNVLIFIYFSGVSLGMWKPAPDFSSCSLWPARTQYLTPMMLFLLCMSFFFLFSGKIKAWNPYRRAKKTWQRRLALKTSPPALAGVVYWLEHQPVHQRVTDSIPSQRQVPGL